MSESIVDQIMKTAERNEKISREIEWCRRLIFVIAAAAFGCGYAVRSIIGNLWRS